MAKLPLTLKRNILIAENRIKLIFLNSVQFKRFTRIIFFIGILGLMSCTKDQLNTQELSGQESVWIFSTEDPGHPGNFKTMKLRFRENGYAYEEGTILKYPYRLNTSLKLFEMNHVLYKIVHSAPGKLVLVNTRTGIRSILTKE